MAAGGYVYEKETATYSSLQFSTKFDWAYYVFRKQIYAFLAASKRSATVNGDAHQYWDLDATRLSDVISIPLEGTNQVHTDAEWRSVSELMTSENYDATDIEPIMTYTSDTNYPALGCFFVGRGGEHLFFCNCVKSGYGTSLNSTAMKWYISSDYTSTLEIFRPNPTSDAYNTCCFNLPVGFSVMFSPNSDFNGNYPYVSGFRPRSCLPPVSIKSFTDHTPTSSDADAATNVIIGNTYGYTFTFGFCVKRDQIIYMQKNDGTWYSTIYHFIIFGNILENLAQEDDTNRQASIVIRSNPSETEVSRIANSHTVPPVDFDYYDGNGAQFPVWFADANGDGVFNINGYKRAECIFKTLSTTIPPFSSFDSAAIPYSSLYVGCSLFRNFSDSSTLVKNGYGFKGFVSTDILRVIPEIKQWDGGSNVGGFTFQNGKFLSLCPYSVSNIDQSFPTPVLSQIIGWDPSNVL